MPTRTHKYPSFVSRKTMNVSDDESKRYSLELVIDKNKTESIVIILKNPSKATDEYSDHTVNRVSNYIYNNRNSNKLFKNIGTITILNLIPLYETDSTKLKGMNQSIYDEKNIEIINKYCSNNSNLIIAWGNHPNGLYKEYTSIKNEVLDIIKRTNTPVFYVQSLSNDGNPKHGQVWAYYDELKRYE